VHQHGEDWRRIYNLWVLGALEGQLMSQLLEGVIGSGLNKEIRGKAPLPLLIHSAFQLYGGCGTGHQKGRVWESKVCVVSEGLYCDLLGQDTVYLDRWVSAWKLQAVTLFWNAVYSPVGLHDTPTHKITIRWGMLFVSWHLEGHSFPYWLLMHFLWKDHFNSSLWT
jgi:hypothetical protein